MKNADRTRPLALRMAWLALLVTGCDLADDFVATSLDQVGASAAPVAGLPAAGARPAASLPSRDPAPAAGAPLGTKPWPAGGAGSLPPRDKVRPVGAEGRPTDGTVWIDDGTDEFSMSAETYKLARATADRPDDLAGHQIHALYLVPKDGADNQHDALGRIGLSMAHMSRWFKEQTRGAQAFRFDTAGDRPDVTFVRMAATTAKLAGSEERLDALISEAVLDAGFDDRAKLYLVYYDGPLTKEMVSVYGLYSTFPIVFLQTFPDGGSQVTAQHELLHALGAVPACAPHTDGESHIMDGSPDLMHGANGVPEEPEPDSVAAAEYIPAQLDPGRDDYYGHGRTDCLDVARSAFLTPLAKGAAADYNRVLQPYPAGGVPLPAPDLTDTDLAVTGLRLVAGPAGSGLATLIGQVAARPGSGRRLVSVSLDASYDAYHLSLGSGRTRAFAIDVPTVGEHQVLLQADDGLANVDGAPTPAVVVRIRAGIAGR